MKEEILINTRLALFFDKSISKPEEIWQDFNYEMENIFDRTPITLPVPKDPKLDSIPVVQMASTDGVYSCNIARGRVDLFITGVGEVKFSDIKSDLFEKTKIYYSFFKKLKNIKRIGFVSRFFVKDEDRDKTISRLVDNKFRHLHGRSIHEVYIRYVSRGEIASFKINNFTTIEKFSARISGMGNNIEGVLITRDFNTIPQLNYQKQFNNKSIKSFLEASIRKFKLDDIKKILWPE